MVMANKWVLSKTEVPLFFLFTQLLIAVLLFIAADFARLLPDRLTFDISICKGLVPMVGLNVLALSFSNFTLKYVEASFYPVARGLILPFTVVTSSLMLGARPSLLILISCTIVTLGFFIGVFLDGTGTVSARGIFYGVTGSLITALHSVVIKKAMDVVSGSALMLSWYTNLLSSVLLLPISILVGEGPGIISLLSNNADPSQGAGGMTALRTFLWGSMITGTIGFAMSLASLLSIKVTSPITHMVSSAVRGVAASLLAMRFFGDVMTLGRATSIAVILGGSVYYTWVKHQEGLLKDKDAGYERVKMDDLESRGKDDEN